MFHRGSPLAALLEEPREEPRKRSIGENRKEAVNAVHRKIHTGTQVKTSAL